jgi:hypothetical protein
MSHGHSVISTEIFALSAIVRVANSVANSIAHFFDAMQRSAVAAREFERLSAMSNEELATLGMDRDAIARHIVHKHLTF